MAITHFLQPTFHLSPLRPSATKCHRAHNVVLRKNGSSYTAITASPKFRIKCFIMDHKPQEEKGFVGEDLHLKKAATSTDGGITWRSMENVTKALQIAVATGVLLLLYDHHHVRLAVAASGGRMGGSTFSSRSSSTSSSSSTSRSHSSSPSYSSSQSYRSESSSPKSSSSSDSYRTQSSMPKSSHSESYRTRSSSPESLFSDSYRTQSSSPKSSYNWVKSSNPKSSSSEIYRTQTSSPVRKQSANKTWSYGFFIIVTLLALIPIYNLFLKKSNADQSFVKTSVLKLQVGLLGRARSLQGDLNRIAEAADTSTSKGLSYVLQEAILALLRHPDYSSVDVKRDIEDVEKLYNQLSIEERGKFDEETLVNVNNIKRQSAESQSSNELCNEYIVVTIIVAASGVPELPPIKSSAQLKKALQNLASIPSSNMTYAVEVLWTPQKENDSLTEEEYLKDYPLLHPL